MAKKSKFPDTVVVNRPIMAWGKVAQRFPKSISTKGRKVPAGLLLAGEVIHGKKMKDGGFTFPMSINEDNFVICRLQHTAIEQK